MLSTRSQAQRAERRSHPDRSVPLRTLSVSRARARARRRDDARYAHPRSPPHPHSAKRHGAPKPSDSTESGQRTADSGQHPDRREGFPARAAHLPPTPRSGMDRRSRAPARKADSGRRTASRPKGGIPGARSPPHPHSAKRHGPPKPSDSTESGQRTADSTPTEGRDPIPRAAHLAPTPRSGMDREARRQHGKRTADSGQHPDRREGFPARAAHLAPHSAKRHGPPKPSASTESGQRTADSIPTEGRDPPCPSPLAPVPRSERSERTRGARSSSTGARTRAAQTHMPRMTCATLK